MKKEELKQLVEYFEDRILNNFEKHFSSLVLEDFYDGGFEERIKDEFFYEEYFSQYEQNIINLLLQIENETSSEFIDFKLRLIKLKRIIDTRLLSSEIEMKQDLLKTGNKRNTQFLLNQNLDKEIFIKKVYDLLLINKLIDCSYVEFRTHFDNTWEGKIKWLGTILQITNFITLLIENNYLLDETKRFKNKLILTHFNNSKGEQFISNRLSSVFSDKKDMTFDDITNDILDELSITFHL